MEVSYPKDFINKVICGDCLEVMKHIPDGAVDLVLTDPPYGVRKAEDWDAEDLFKEQIGKWFKELNRVSKKTIWFCAGKMLPIIFEANDAPFFRLLQWNKPAGSQYSGASHNNIWYSTEPILLFGGVEDFRKVGKDSVMSFASYDAFTIPKKTFGHPTSKQVKLFEWLLIHHSNPNDLILDPFLGSGTTPVACKQLGRRYIGIEINQKYCDIANERLRQEELF